MTFRRLRRWTKSLAQIMRRAWSCRKFSNSWTFSGLLCWRGRVRPIARRPQRITQIETNNHKASCPKWTRIAARQLWKKAWVKATIGHSPIVSTRHKQLAVHRICTTSCRRSDSIIGCLRSRRPSSWSANLHACIKEWTKCRRRCEKLIIRQ